MKKSRIFIDKINKRISRFKQIRKVWEKKSN